MRSVPPSAALWCWHWASACSPRCTCSGAQPARPGGELQAHPGPGIALRAGPLSLRLGPLSPAPDLSAPRRRPPTRPNPPRPPSPGHREHARPGRGHQAAPRRVHRAPRGATIARPNTDPSASRLSAGVGRDQPRSDQSRSGQSDEDQEPFEDQMVSGMCGRGDLPPPTAPSAPPTTTEPPAHRSPTRTSHTSSAPNQWRDVASAPVILVTFTPRRPAPNRTAVKWKFMDTVGHRSPKVVAAIGPPDTAYSLARCPQLAHTARV